MSLATLVRNSKRFSSEHRGDVMSADLYVDKALHDFSDVNLEINDEVPDIEASSTADGAPSYSSPNSTVTVDDAIFTSAMIARKIVFKATKNEYRIVSYSSSKIVVVRGNASSEADEDIVSVYSGYFIFASVAGQPQGQGKPIISIKALKRRIYD